MIIFTSIDNFSSKKRDVKNYRELDEIFVEWIEETTIKLLTNRNYVEKKAGKQIKAIFKNVYEQPFFMINGRSYFLDFYIPEIKVAIEIDGSYHKDRKKRDKTRDNDFYSIGIKTVRISSKKIINKGFSLEYLKTKPKKKKKKRTRPEPIPFRKAWKRVKEHDKMKYHAKWI